MIINSIFKGIIAIVQSLKWDYEINWEYGLKVMWGLVKYGEVMWGMVKYGKVWWVSQSYDSEFQKLIHSIFESFWSPSL